MIARVRKSMDEKDRGFTLIELLVVIIIIGILSAIAIPVFMNQRKKANDASLKSDLRTVATTLETQYNDVQKYYVVATSGTTSPLAALTGSGATTATDTKVAVTFGNTITGTLNTAKDAYCLKAVNTEANASNDWYYVSSQGGLQDRSTGACPTGAF